MNKKILVLLIFVPTMLCAQKTQKVTNKVNNETFYVLKSDKKIRHGEYKNFNFFGKLVVNGYYKYGAKDSIWDCFDRNGELISKYNYTKNELVFYNPNVKLIGKKYRLLVDGNKLDTILSKPPLFLAGDEFFMSKIQYPIIAQQKGISGRVVVFFTVDKFGKTTNYHVKTPIGYGMDEEVIRVLKLIPDFWLPGFLNEEPVDIEVEFPFNFRNLGLINKN